MQVKRGQSTIGKDAAVPIVIGKPTCYVCSLDSTGDGLLGFSDGSLKARRQ